jgi:molybdopterin-synthase adenylyltransferase
MYETLDVHPQRVGGWAHWVLNDDALLVARDRRRIVVRPRPDASLTLDALKDLFGLLDGRRSVDGVVDALLDRHPTASPAAVRQLLRTLADKCVLVDAQAPVPAGLTADDVASYRRFLAYYSEFETAERSRYDIMLAVKQSRVGIVGLGGAGSLIAASLVSSGVRQLIGIDGDAVEATNLHRQLFFHAEDIDRPKAEALRDRLTERTPDLDFRAVPSYLMDPGELDELLDGVDLVIHVADYPPRNSRLVTTQACVRRGVPVLVFFNTYAGPLCVPGKSACFRCYERTVERAHAPYQSVSGQLDAGGPYTSRTRPGVNMLMCGLLTSEAVSFLSGVRTPATVNGMISVDPVAGAAHRIAVERDPLCDVCGDSSAGQAADGER